MKAQKYSLKTTEKKPTRPADKADDMIRSALSLAEKGFIKEAVDELEKARGISPDNLEILLNLGFIHTIQGNFKSAFDTYAQATLKHPREPLSHLALGNLYWFGGQAEKAVEQWKLIRGRFKPDSELNILSRSEVIWQRMLEIDPVDADAHSNLGLVYLFSGELNKALAEFQAVTRIDASRREHDFYQAQVLVLLYLNRSNRNHRSEANKILAGLSEGSDPFPHAERLNTFVKSL